MYENFKYLKQSLLNSIADSHRSGYAQMCRRQNRTDTYMADWMDFFFHFLCFFSILDFGIRLYSFCQNTMVINVPNTIEKTRRDNEKQK